MSILLWNVRGMTKKGRRKDAKDHFKSLSPSILALVETKVKLNKLDGLKCCVPHNWPSNDNFHLSSQGRIGLHGTQISGFAMFMLFLFNISLFKLKTREDCKGI